MADNTPTTEPLVSLANVNLGHYTPVEIAGSALVLLVEPDGVGTVSVKLWTEEEPVDAGDQP